jgi:hypothetical protein
VIPAFTNKASAAEYRHSKVSLATRNPAQRVNYLEKKMTKFKLLHAAAILSMLIATPVLAHGSRIPQQVSGAYGREVAAPPWSAACMTDHGPSDCGEPMWVYGRRGENAGWRNAF